MADISVGSVSVDVVPDAGALRQRIKAAFKGLNASIPVDADTKAATAKIAEVTRPAALKIIASADTAKAKAELGKLQSQLKDKVIALNISTAEAKSRLAEVSAEIARTKSTIKLDADDTAAITKLAGLRALARDIRFNLDVDTAPAKAAIAEINAEVARANGTVKINVDADVARAEAKLAEVSRARDATVNADADTAAASVKLALLARARTVIITVVVPGAAAALASISPLIGAVVLLGTALIPIAAAATAAMGAIAAGAVVAGAAVGVLVLGFSGVGKAMKALGDAGKDTAAAATQHAAAAAQVVSANAALAASERSLKDARANAADAAVKAAQAVSEAQRGVKAAEQDAADAAISSARAVADARRNLVSATQQASQATKAALAGIVTAEENLKAAQVASKAAQDDLTRARQDAKIAMEDLNNAVIDGNLSERQAEINLKAARDAQLALGATTEQIAKQTQVAADAKAAYDKVVSDPSSTAAQKAAAQVAVQSSIAQLEALKNATGGTADQRKAAQLAYEQAQQALKEIQLRNERLAKEKKKSDKDGVEGSDAVTEAQKRAAEAAKAASDAQKAILAAQQNADDVRKAGAESVAKAQRDLADAQKAQTRQAVDSAAKIADAQRGVTNALRDQAAQQRSSASAIASAQAGVASSQRAVADAMKKSAETGVAASDKLKKSLAGLPASTVGFAKFLRSIGPQLKVLKTTAADGLLPGVTEGIKAALPLLPTFNKLVGVIAKALGGLATEAGKGLGSPTFRKFFDYLGKNAGPLIETFGGIIGDLATGFVGLVTAFKPITDQVFGGLKDLTGQFAKFGSTAGDKNSGFQGFLTYVQPRLPKVAKFFGNLTKAIGKILEVFAPLGDVVLTVVSAIAGFIATADPKLLAGIAIAIGAVGIAIAIAMDANPLGLIILAITLVAAGFAYLWKHSETFQKIVTAAVHGVVVGFDALVIAVKAVGTFFVWLWDKIVAGARWLYDVLFGHSIIPDIINGFVSFLTALKDWVLGAFAKAWDLIKDVFVNPILNAVNAIKGFFDAKGPFRTAFRAVKDWVLGAFRKVWAGVEAVYIHPIQNVVSRIQGFFGVKGPFRAAFNAVKDWVLGAFKKVWAGVEAVYITPISNAISKIQGFFGEKGPVRKAFNAIKDWAINTFKDAWAVVEGFISSPVQKAKDAVGKILGAGKDGIQTVFSSAVSAIGTLWSGLKKLASDPIVFIIDTVLNHGIIDAFNGIVGAFPGGDKLKIGYIPVPGALKLARGGPVNGPGTGTSDSILARLSHGEFVTNARATKRNRAILDEINSGTNFTLPPGFRAGGFVPQKQPNEKVPYRKRSRLETANSDDDGNVGRDDLKKNQTSSSDRIVKPTRSGRQNSSYPGHTGIDFFGHDGDPIFATTAGQIYYRGSGRGYGNALFERSNKGLKMVYGHTSRYLVSSGQKVTAGMQIANVGHSGNVRPRGPGGAHLHFEIAPGGRFAIASNRGATQRWISGKGLPKGGSSSSGDSDGDGSSDSGLSLSDFLGSIKAKFLAPFKKMDAKLGDSPVAKIMKQMPHAAAAKILERAKDAADIIGDFIPDAFKGDNTTSGANQKLGKAMLEARYGDSSQWPALKALWTGESGWNERAKNASSGAYGIPQALPARKLASAGADWRTSAATQIKWGLKYIADRYKTPSNAYGQWLNRHPHWYANGTSSTEPGYAMVGERGPELVRFSGGQAVYPAAQSAAMLSGNGVTLTGNFNGYTPKDVADEIYKRQRDTAALHPVWS